MRRVFKICYDILANSITDLNGVCELMDCSATVFTDEFSNFITFYVVLLVHGRPDVRHLQLTLERS
jgi:hypothetical protein